MAPPQTIRLGYVLDQIAQGRTQKAIADELGGPANVISALLRYGQRGLKHLHIGIEPKKILADMETNTEARCRL